MITLEDDMYEMLSALAERDNQSLSKTAADIITKTLERYEDQVLYEMAAERMKSGPLEYLTDEEVWPFDEFGNEKK